MRIAFVLPAPVRVPSGGAAVVYRHAAGLAARGHDVEVVAPRGLGWGGVARSLAIGVRDRLHGVPDVPYYAAPGVRTLEPRQTGEIAWEYDSVIATGLQTVQTVIGKAGREGWWLVQGDETFVHPAARQAWRLGLRHIPCSTWLAREVQEEGGEVSGVVPNAVDLDAFDLDTDIGSRAPHVLALYHRHPVKGPGTLIDAFRAIRTARPDARLTVFSARPPSHRLPEGVEVVIRPEPSHLRALYNQAALFLHTSQREGWALTPMEAAVCGCAIVATDSQGPSEYLRAGVSMRLHAVGDAQGLATSALDLLARPAVRTALAQAGRESALSFSWTDSSARLEEILTRRQP